LWKRKIEISAKAKRSEHAPKNFFGGKPEMTMEKRRVF